MSRYHGNYEYDPQGYDPKTDMPTMDLTTLSVFSKHSPQKNNSSICVFVPQIQGRSAVNH